MAQREFTDIPFTSMMTHNLLVLQFFGYWYPNEKIRTWKTPAYKVYSSFMILFSFFFYMMAEFLEMVSVFGDIEKMIESSFLLLTHMAEASKIFYWLKYQCRMRSILEWLNGEVFEPKNHRQYQMLKRATIWYGHFYKVFMAMGCATCALWALFPQLNTEKRILPLKTWSPFSKTETPGYEITYTYQIVAVWINAMVNITFDSTAAVLMVLVSVQLDYLNDSLLNIREDSEKIVEKNFVAAVGGVGGEHVAVSRLDRGFVAVQDNVITGNKVRVPPDVAMEPKQVLIFPPELQKSMDYRLRECVNHHRAILKFVSVVRDLFSFSVLMQFIASTIIVCITMFKLTLVPFFTVEFISLILYQACMLFELFCYCWFGNEIILGSGKLSQSAYQSHWYGSDKNYMKKLLFFMVRTKEPMKLYAGGFFTLSVETFMKILKSSWSYFAVLQSVNT